MRFEGLQQVHENAGIKLWSPDGRHKKTGPEDPVLSIQLDQSGPTCLK